MASAGHIRILLCAAIVGGALGCQPQAGDGPRRTNEGITGGGGASDGRGTAGSGGSDPSGQAGSGGSNAPANPPSAGGSGGSGPSGGIGDPGSGGSGSGEPAGGQGADAAGDAREGTAAIDATAGGGEGGMQPGAASPGCGRSNPAGTFMITAGAAQTPYRVVLPTGYDPNRPYPLVFYLHGRGNNIEGQGTLTTQVAGANRGIVVYPKSFGSSGWEVPNRDRPEENLALLRALLKHMGDQYCVDTRKVIMSGFSSGCWFASRLACTMKDQLAGVVAAACGLDPMGRCPDRKPITYIIGRGDGAFGGAPAAAEFYRTRNACQMSRKPAATAPCEQYDGCAAGAGTTYCPHPGGHQWPAFAARAVLEMLDKL